MNPKFQPADLNSVSTYSIKDRKTKVQQTDFAQLGPPDATLAQFTATLPDILKVKDLRNIVKAIAHAYKLEKPVIVGMGGHVIKCGLSPLFIHLMEIGLVSAVIMNGGASIHDFEIATIGSTSEDVAVNLETGMFGMVQETPKWMNYAISAGAHADIGMGAALGNTLLEMNPPHMNYSILASGARLGIPVCVHVAIGADTIHMHPSVDSAAIGKTSFTDFRILVSVLKHIGEGGVYLNIGSAVVLPEVFVKALNLARNLSKGEIKNFTTVNMDMIQHYRPLENVVKRPTQSGGAGYTLTGHHEIMVPLLVHLVLAELAIDEG